MELELVLNTHNFNDIPRLSFTIFLHKDIIVPEHPLHPRRSDRVGLAIVGRPHQIFRILSQNVVASGDLCSSLDLSWINSKLHHKIDNAYCVHVSRKKSM